MLPVTELHVKFAPNTAPSAPPKGVDLWLLDLTQCSQVSPANYLKSLPAADRVRAQQFSKNQAQFLFTRLFLRNVLAHYTGLATQQIEIERDRNGKPFLANTAYPLWFNLSHTQNFAVLAVSTLGKVGVDAETMRKRNILKIAERYFHADEVRQLKSCTANEQSTLFFKLWTLKEAFFKATGGGISTGLDKVHFKIEGKTILPTFAPALKQSLNDWQLQQFLLHENLFVSLAVETNKPLTSQWFYGNDLPGLA